MFLSLSMVAYCSINSVHCENQGKVKIAIEKECKKKSIEKTQKKSKCQ